MKKLFAVLSLTLFMVALASPVMASQDEKPKKAKTECAEKKEGCAKTTASAEKDCAAKCSSGKATAEKK